MQTKERKERLQALAAEIAQSNAREVDQTLELLDLSYEDAKERLVNAMGEDIPRVQGEARILERLHRQLQAGRALLRQNQGA